VVETIAIGGDRSLTQRMVVAYRPIAVRDSLAAGQRSSGATEGGTSVQTASGRQRLVRVLHM